MILLHLPISMLLLYMIHDRCVLKKNGDKDKLIVPLGLPDAELSVTLSEVDYTSTINTN